jgi:hypothetical protein
MSRGVLYIKFGNAIDGVLQRSLRSLRAFHPELPVHVHDEPMPTNLLCKAKMGAITPFDETLYLDSDTVVLSRLDYGFEQAKRFGLACCINECPWAKRYAGFAPDVIEYNTGVLFFTRERQLLFERWSQCAGRVDSTVAFYTNGQTQQHPFQDQAPFAKAVEELGVSPFVLPLNWNFRPEWHLLFFGPIKIWHGYKDPPPSLADWNRDQSAPGAVIKYGLVHGPTPQ